MAFSFQLTGGLYLGSLNEMIGGMSLMREDILMCLYMNLAGMAIYFPILFRMKFRFTNKTLLIGAAATLAVCNMLTITITLLPLLWIVCFIAGCAKIQGTFECMSNIQLWITPKRNFGVFFPVLHIIILCSMQISDLLTAHLTYHFGWKYMHLFIIALMLAVILTMLLLTKRCRIIPKVTLRGIDWTGGMLWVLFSAQIIYIFNYGDWLDWYNSPIITTITGTALITLGVAVHRMFHSLHPFIEPEMWRSKYMKPIILLIAIVEALFATEHVLEEIFMEEGLKYASITSSLLDWAVIAGILFGVAVSLLWLNVLRMSYYKLLAIGMGALALYLAEMYARISPSINMQLLCEPLFLRGFSYAVLSATLMLSLQQVMSFKHFFQSLCVFNMLHMTIGGVVGAAIYATGMRYYMSDNIARYAQHIDSVRFTMSPFDFGEWMEKFIESMLMVSVKQIYGWVLYVCIFVTLMFLLYDRPFVRHTLRRIPSWRTVGRRIAAMAIHYVR